MVATNDPLIQQLNAERENLTARIAAIDNAIEALVGTRPATNGGRNRERLSVGDDKVAMILSFITERGEVRQAEIGRALALNTGTVSTATRRLAEAGEIVQGPKRDRSVTWRSASA